MIGSNRYYRYSWCSYYFLLVFRPVGNCWNIPCPHVAAFICEVSVVITNTCNGQNNKALAAHRKAFSGVHTSAKAKEPHNSVKLLQKEKGSALIICTKLYQLVDLNKDKYIIYCISPTSQIEVKNWNKASSLPLSLFFPLSQAPLVCLLQSLSNEPQGHSIIFHRLHS